MGGSVGVLQVVLPTHLGRIQLSFALKKQCIITSKNRFAEALMALANANVADAGGARLTALTVEAVVLLLKRSGSQQVSVDSVRADLAAGAPHNADGTINLIAYGAWLVRDLARRDGGHAD